LQELAHDLIVAEAVVGHQCPSAALAVRMTRCACEQLATFKIATDDRLIVYVEMDACAAAATGALMGRPPLGLRHMTLGSLGQMTVTMVDPGLGRGLRVGVQGPALAMACQERLISGPEIADAELFTLTEVQAEHDPPYVPGRALWDVEAGTIDHGLAVAHAPQSLRETFFSPNRHGTIALSTWLPSLVPWPLRARGEWPHGQGVR
jgi:hypothetical protein